MKTLKSCIITLFITVIISCSKKDEPTPTPTPLPTNNQDSLAPVITLTGSGSITISLNSAWTDPGATANDDQDGNISVISNVSLTNPNINLIGIYTIIYTATDSAGNVSTRNRTVTVKNDADYLADTYSVYDTIFSIGSLNYSQTITADSTVNNRIRFRNFLDYQNNNNIVGLVASNGAISIQLQTAIQIGSGTGYCDIVDHKFNSIQYTQLSNGFKIQYNDEVISPGCQGAVQGIATFTR